MGCDIHLYKEKKLNGQWVAADEWVSGEDWEGNECLECNTENYGGRNYNLFGTLSAGVRRNTKINFQPRGVPFNACKEVADHAERWGVDGHSHSYLYLHELKELAALCKTETINISGMMNGEQWKKVQEEAKKPEPNWSVIYPYCQWSSSSADVEFSVDVPLSYMIGDCLQSIISAFEGVDGENHRIVFWFDN